MTITRGLAGAAMLAGLAVGTASTAWADPPTMSGSYILRIPPLPDGGFDFTPCGPGCAKASASYGTTEAHLVNGQWSMDDNNPGGVRCVDGSTHPTVFHMTWDPYTLTGQRSGTQTEAACGSPAGAALPTRQLTWIKPRPKE
jgi:hypothetical protein